MFGGARRSQTGSQSCPFRFQVEGSELKKIRTNSRVYQRYYLLDTGLQALCWEPSKKESDKARISLDSIREVCVAMKKRRPETQSFPVSTASSVCSGLQIQVRTGRNTETFRTSGVYEQISEDCAFSIIYGEFYESLDLVANSAEVANIWVTGLRSEATIVRRGSVLANAELSRLDKP